MSNSEGQYHPAGRVRSAFAAVAVLGLVLAACGGGNGGNGNGDAAYTLRVAFANETEEEATIAMNDGEAQVIDSCKGGVFSFAMPVEAWILTVNGETAIDSLEYQPNELDNDVAARLWLYDDGSLELDSFLPGSNISAPAALSICT